MASQTARDWTTYWTNKKPPNFSVGKSTAILDRVDYRLAETVEEKDKIYELRYRAYLREGMIHPSADGRFTDRYDEAPNSWTFGIYVEGELYSSIRISVVNRNYPLSPSVEAFGDVLEPEIERGKTIIDPTQFVADPVRARRLPELPYITVRLAFLACAHFEADLYLATVRAEHQAFYRRVFSQTTICEPRFFPGLFKPLGLLGANYDAVREGIFERYPYLRSSNFERRMLFQRDSSKFLTAKQSLAEIKSHLRTIWNDDPVLPLCIEILDRVTISPLDEETLDFSALCRITGKNRPDTELLKAITILTTSSLPALRVCAKAKADDGREYDVNSEDLSEATNFATAALNDPGARQAIDDFAGRLVIYFVPTSIFENPPAEISAVR